MSPSLQMRSPPSSDPDALWSARADELTDAGAEGELLVAKARLGFTAMILAAPIVSVIDEPARVEGWVGLIALTVSSLIALLVLLQVRSGWRPKWLGFATSLFDVTMVTLVLASYFVVGTAHMAINARVTYPIYFLAIGASCLRYDRRVCLTTGFAAAVQYSLLVVVAVTRYDLNSVAFSPFPYGMYSSADQIGRVILLLIATVLATTIVDRTERLRVLSTHDGLTGLYNRAYFDERLVEEVLRARRYARPLSLVIIDLDRFKQVNDVHGHLTGDLVLRRFADYLRDAMRRTDTVTRFGGEEFALILPETSVEDAVTKLTDVCAQVNAIVIEAPNGVPVRLTFSAGVAGMPGDGESAESLISRADARLLDAKTNGRNAVMGPRIVLR